ncbi:aldose epimerase family protein [Sphingomonas sp. ASY06-1R]|uniref:aldose epimerase family protein n=1 Tax=Sphingomonas sp. ASY06-1R TaxID=3445771 RepID=UPI003FA3092D
MMIDITQHAVRLRDGRDASVFRIAAPGGIALWVAELGATLLRIEAPDRNGHCANVILGDVDIGRYPAALGLPEDPRFGASCGRVANRTAGAAFVLDGTRFALDENESPNHLHGGRDGFSRRLWRGRSVPDGVEMTLSSADGDQGYPGDLSVLARFALVAADTLAVTYRATSDRPTHVNIVSHPYFNLSGDPAATIDRHQLAIAADSFLPIDAMALPDAAAQPVAGTPFDFRAPREVGSVIDADHPQIHAADGFNHCFVLSTDGPRQQPCFAARIHCPASGRVMTLSTDQPALQFYSGNALCADGEATGSQLAFARRTGLCLEAQAFPNAANRPDFPTTRLDPGQEYRSELRLHFAVEA